MPTPAEIENLLIRLDESIKEAKEATTQAHVATKESKQATKDAERVMPDAMRKAAEVAMAEVGADIRATMESLLLDVMERIEADWRKALRLDPR